MHDELPASTDVAVIATYHAESHGIVGPLGNVLHQLQGLAQLGCGQPRLLGRLLQVSEEELVLTDPLDRLDEEGGQALAVLQLVLDVLW